MGYRYERSWLWAQWVRECSAARLAISEGRYDTASKFLTRAEAVSEQLSALGEDPLDLPVDVSPGDALFE